MSTELSPGIKLDNHSNTRVPDEEAVNGFRIALVIIGIAITLPAFLIGAEIISSLGAIQGLIAIFSAGLILTCLAIPVMLVGTKSRLSTYQIMQFPFGRLGAKASNLLLSISLLGWFGVTASLFGQAAQQATAEVAGIQLPVMFYTGFGSLLVIFTTIVGFQAIEKLSRLSVPLMLVVLLMGVYKIVSIYSWQDIVSIPAQTGRLSNLGLAISAVVGGFMVGVTIVSDMSRFSSKGSHSVFAAVFSYGTGFVIILIAAGLPSLVTAEKDLIKSFYEVGLGLPVLFIVIFATWTTNANNLYSSSLGFAQLFPKSPDWLMTSVIGLLGTLLAMIGVIDHFVSFLLLLAIAIPPLAGIYLVDFYVLNNARYDLAELKNKEPVNVRAYLSWLAGTSLGFMTTQGYFSLSSIPVCDSLISGALVYWLIYKVYESGNKE